MSFNPGEQVGAYRVIEQLGQGGMATVYKAYHPALDRYVALKVLHPAFLEDKNFQARFVREAKLVAKLEHPNIVPIYDFAEHEGRPYLVMKFIEGITLKARISQGSIGNEDILRIVEAVGAALAYAHKRGILHRDVKPSNVILASDGQIYLADFGLARIAQSGETTLTTDMVIGTPQYISPEQALGKKELDEGTDIYSFGVMLYEMTVGRVPFSADTPFSIIHDHIYTPLPLPSVENPSVSADLERVLLKALAKERSDRYADVPALVEAFKQAWIGQTGFAPTVISTSPDAVTIPPVPIDASQMPQEQVPVNGPTSRPEVQSAGDSGIQAPKKKRKIPRWAWILLMLFLCFCCVFVFLASRQSKNQLTFAQETANAFVITSLPTNYAPTVQAAIETSMPITAPVQTARKAVQQNPDDPQARLNLAVVYADAGMRRLAMEELKKTVELGANNREFLSNAGGELIKRQYWLPAAMMYLRLGKLVGVGGMEQAQLELFHEAVYKAAVGTDYQFFDVIPLADLQSLDGTLALIAQVRYYASKGDANKTQQYAIELKNMNPNIPEYRLFSAQIAVNQNRTEEARSQLKGLIDDSSVTEWVKQEARETLKKLPQ
jgi:serine/threonine protein kinase